jgi:hypothetical protein
LGVTPKAARRLTWLAFGMVAVTSACQLVVSLDDNYKNEEAEASSGEAGVEASPTGIDPCGPLLERGPAAQDPPPSLKPIVFALLKWRLVPIKNPALEPDLCPTPGFNLDNLVTGPAGVCANPACASRDKSKHLTCDLADGVDNSLASLLNFAQTLPGATEAIAAFDPDRVIASGAVNLLVVVNDYNGEAQDDSVSVDFYTSSGTDTFDKGDAGYLSITNIVKMPITWDGGDAAFAVDPKSVLGDPESDLLTPRYRAEDAFVRDGFLVVPSTGLGVLPLGLPGGGALEYSSGTLMAKIGHLEDGRFLLTHGRFGARASSRAVLTAVGAGRTPDTTANDQLCAPQNRDSYRDYFKTAICAAADLPPDAGPNDPTATCDDMSAGVSFVAIETRFAKTEATDTRQPHTLTRPNPLGDTYPCPDGLGNYWCDDCRWDAAQMCDGGPVDAGADADAPAD